MPDFTNRTAVITGAAKGIGAATAARLLHDGVSRLALLDMDYEKALHTAKAIDPSGACVTAFACNVASEEDVKETFASIYEKFGHVDILVNNAGIVCDKMFHTMPIEQFKLVLDVHLYGTVYCTQQVLPHMRQQGYGKIVNLASVAMYGNIGQANYAAAKAGIVGLSKTLAKESGAKGITVNCVAPGFIETDIIKDVPAEKLEAARNSHPMKRLGKPDEVAAVIAFLASDDSSYVSGQCIDCSGGL